MRGRDAASARTRSPRAPRRPDRRRRRDASDGLRFTTSRLQLRTSTVAAIRTSFSSISRSMFIAACAAWNFTISRPPKNWNVRTRRLVIVAPRTAIATRADRLLRRAAARSGDPGDADADVRARARADAVGHRPRDRLADRAVLANQRRGHAGQLGLRAVAVADDAAVDVVGAAGHVGQPRRQQSAGARLGDRDRQPPARAAGRRRPLRARGRRRCRPTGRAPSCSSRTAASSAASAVGLARRPAPSGAARSARAPRESSC